MAAEGTTVAGSKVRAKAGVRKAGGSSSAAASRGVRK